MEEHYYTKAESGWDSEDERLRPKVKSFIFTEESLQDLIFVLGVEDGLEAFLNIVKAEALMYLDSVGPRWNEDEREYIKNLMGY